MKLKSALFCLLSLSTLSSFGVIVKMPNAQILHQKIEFLGLRYFNEKTHLIDNLANKELNAVQVAFAIERALDKFSEHIKNNPTMAEASLIMLSLKPFLLKSLLEDFPEAIKELEDMDLLPKQNNNLRG